MILSMASEVTKTYLNITNKGVPMESSNNLKQNNISDNKALFTTVNMKCFMSNRNMFWCLRHVRPTYNKMR